MFGVVAVTAASATSAELPSRSRSRTAGPRRGSVTFWELTPPMPSARWMQRAATAGDDEQIADPMAPEPSRATMENVIGRRPR